MNNNVLFSETFNIDPVLSLDNAFKDILLACGNLIEDIAIDPTANVLFPNPSQTQLQKEVNKHVALFNKSLDSMDLMCQDVIRVLKQDVTRKRRETLDVKREHEQPNINPQPTLIEEDKDTDLIDSVMLNTSPRKNIEDLDMTDPEIVLQNNDPTQDHTGQDVTDQELNLDFNVNEQNIGNDLDIAAILSSVDNDVMGIQGNTVDLDNINDNDSKEQEQNSEVISNNDIGIPFDHDQLSTSIQPNAKMDDKDNRIDPGDILKGINMNHTMDIEDSISMDPNHDDANDDSAEANFDHFRDFMGDQMNDSLNQSNNGNDMDISMPMDNSNFSNLDLSLPNPENGDLENNANQGNEMNGLFEDLEFML